MPYERTIHILVVCIQLPRVLFWTLYSWTNQYFNMDGMPYSCTRSYHLPLTDDWQRRRKDRDKDKDQETEDDDSIRLNPLDWINESTSTTFLESPILYPQLRWFNDHLTLSRQQRRLIQRHVGDSTTLRLDSPSSTTKDAVHHSWATNRDQIHQIFKN